MEKYDYLIVGAGLFGCVFAQQAIENGKTCLIIEKREKLGGNIRTEEIEGIQVHLYGPHIFHTNDESVWDYMNRFAKFNNFILSPIANYKGQYFNLPFNMNTFYQLWGETSPERIKTHIKNESKSIIIPQNLKEQAISMVGYDIYEKLIKEYTEKQWGKKCEELPTFIIKRLPLRYCFNNNYFDDKYQGIPIGGYTEIINKLIKGCDVLTGIDYFDKKEYFNTLANKVVYTGQIDKFYDYCYGELEYRSLSFKTEILNIPNYQGNSIINFTSHEVPYTRIIEHKHFECLSSEDVYKTNKTIITKEFPEEFKIDMEPYYPINDKKNNDLYLKYKKKADNEKHYIFGGRLAEYKYYNMDDVIKSALITWKNNLD